MLCYFPREGAHEDFACVRLPVEIGDTEGAPSLPDRRIRIFSNPVERPEDDEAFTIIDDVNRDFVEMKDDIDRERLLGSNKKRRSINALREPERQIITEIESKERWKMNNYC